MHPDNDRNTERWYILIYIGNQHQAAQQLDAVEGLRYYAPVFFEQEHQARCQTCVCLNYAFVFGSQNYIYDLKKSVLFNFNFMRSKTQGGVCHPYVSDLEIEQMQKVERLNDGKIPFTLCKDNIFVGDKVEILTGEYKGYTATAISRNRSKYHKIYLCIGQLLKIPLGKLTKEEFRIIKYANPSRKTSDFSLPKERAARVIESVKRFHGIMPSDEAKAQEDCDAMATLIAQYERQKLLTINNRLKVQSLLALAYMIKGDTEKSLRYMKLSNSVLQEKITKVSRLYFATLRYLSTGLPNHYKDYKVLKTAAGRSFSPSSSLCLFVECAEELNKQLANRKLSNTTSEVFTGGMNREYWFCLSAPKKKTEAIRFFHDKGITVYAPIVSDGKPDEQKNILKDLFFVRMTYDALINLRNENHLFNILTQTIDQRKHILTYSDEVIEIFDYVNNLDIPNKELLHFTPLEESFVLKSQQKVITLSNREIRGYLMSTRTGKKVEQKILFLLTAVAAIAIKL